MALRTPTFAYPWYPSILEKWIAVMISFDARALRLTPSMKSWMLSTRVPSTDASSICASSALSTGSVSPAGEHVPKFPPIVPAARICGEPTVRAASLSA